MKAWQQEAAREVLKSIESAKAHLRSGLLTKAAESLGYAQKRLLMGACDRARDLERTIVSLRDSVASLDEVEPEPEPASE